MYYFITLNSSLNVVCRRKYKGYKTNRISFI